MAAGLFQDLGVALKTVYPTKAVEAIINEETPFREALSKNLPAGGRVSEGELKFNGVLKTPQNVGQIFDGAPLQDAAERYEVQFSLKPTIFQATMNIGWLTKAAANSNKSTFNGGESRRRTEETISNFGKFMESTYVGTAGNGVRAYLETTGTVSGLVMRQPEGVKLLREGMKISVRQAADITTAQTALDALRIDTITPSTRLVTLKGSPTYTNGVTNDMVLVVTETTQTPTALYANGIRGIIDDGTYAATLHGLTRSTAAYGGKLYAQVAGNGGVLRNLSEKILMQAFLEQREKTGKRITDVWWGPGQIIKYIDFVAPDRQRPVSGGTYDKGTGFKSMEEFTHYAPGVAVKFHLSFDIIPREMFGFNWDSWFHYVARAADWVTDDQMLHLGVGTANYVARWDAFLAAFENIGCDMPAAQIVFRDLKDPMIGDV
jgi:hypothetical protein